MEKLLEEIRSAKLCEICMIVLSVVILGLILINAETLELSRATRMVRTEMRRMGHSEEAAIVTLERAGQTGVFRASIPIQGEDGLVIEYWVMRRISFSSFTPTPTFRIEPFHDYSP